MGVSFIEYKGKEILYVDHRGLSGDKLIVNLKEGMKMMLEKGKGILSLSDFRGSNLSNEVLSYGQSAEMKEALKLVKKDAIVGAAGIKKVALLLFIKLTGSKVGVFDTLEEAKEYLVS